MKPALCAPVVFHVSLATLLKCQMAHRFWLLISSGSKKKEPKCSCLIEAKASHWQRMWAEVWSSAPHFLHSGLSINPIKRRCLCRILWPARSLVTTLDCTLVRDKSPILVPQKGPEISSRACRWESPRFRHHLWCWFPNQRLILLWRSHWETTKAGSSPTYPEAELSLANLSGVSLPRTPACWLEILFNASWHWRTSGDIVLTALRAFRAAWLSEQILTCFPVNPWASMSCTQARMANTSAWKTVAYRPRGRLSFLLLDCP
jgi:hypothetical protein